MKIIDLMKDFSEKDLSMNYSKEFYSKLHLKGYEY